MLTGRGDFSAWRRRRSIPDDDELPPPPVSPPRAAERSAGAPPGYSRPSLEAGRIFREANLPRRVPEKNQPTGHRLARPGEKDPDGNLPPLYEIWGSNYADLDEFGIGVGLYFRQLMLLGVVIFLCAVIYIPSIVHNAGFQGGETPAYLTGTAFNATRSDLSLNLNGVPDLIVTLALCIFAMTARKMEKAAVEKIDIRQQTPQDYTVCIHSPPHGPGLTNPDTYFDKFRKFGRIVFVTVCLNNGNLMKTVAAKRVIEHKLTSLRAHRSMNTLSAEDGKKVKRTRADLNALESFLQRKLGLFATEDYLEEALKMEKEKLKGLSHRGYEPQRVYITFETEEAQRNCLKAVETGLWEERLQQFRRRGINEEAMIYGKICRINEAEEPSEVLWQYIDTTIFRRATTWALAGFLSMLFLGLAFVLLFYIADRGWWAGIIVALVNAVLPLVIRVLTLALEEHKSLTHVQASMMFKLVVARGINSACLLFIITEYTQRFKEEALVQILSILIADAFSTPFLRLTNVADVIGRRLLGPKQKTQAEMNVFFQGAPWNLAERYTDMIKTVFVGLFYSAIFPAGLFITSVTMVTLYWVDKYSLLRQWRRPPAYDASLSTYARKAIILCIWVHLVMARVFFAYWPCEDDDEKPDCGLFSCNEAEEGKYTTAQRQIVNIYEVLGVLVFGVGGGFLGLYYIKHYATKLMTKKHHAVGDASNTSYRQVKGIDAYIPLICVKELCDPLLAIDVQDLPENAIPYLPLRIGGTYHASELSMNSSNDFPDLGKEERDHLFGTVKYYAGQGETLRKVKPTGGFLFEATVEDQETFRAEEDFTGGLQRQLSVVRQQSFMIPARPVKEDAGPQRLRKHTPQFPSQEAPLPTGWEERTTGTGRKYYVSHESRISQWERPTVDAVTSSRDGCKVDMHSAVRDLPPGWELRYADDGRPYYVDHNTQQTQWEHPGHVGNPSLGGGVSYSSGVDPSEGGTRIVEQYTATGLKYYVNPRTKETQWSPPKVRGRSNGPKGGGSSGSRQQHTARTGDVDVSSSEVSSTSRGGRSNLPAGWEKRTNEAGRAYYVNHAQRITQWQHPDGATATAAPNAGGYETHQQQQPAPRHNGSSGHGGGGGGYGGGHGARVSGVGADIGLGDAPASLPGDIEQRTAPDGRLYYVNHRTQVTSWNPPRQQDFI